MAALEVIGFGAMSIDRVYRVDNIVADGEQIIKDFEASPGGSAANTIYGLARLGIKAGFIGSVDNDEDGEELISSFKAVGVDTSQIKVKSGEHTGAAICLSDRTGKRALYISPGANDLLRSEDINLDYLDQAQIVHFSSFANDVQFRLQSNLINRIRNEVKISLAPGMLYANKGIKALSPLFRRTHAVFMNKDEIELLTGKDFRAGAQECLKLGCQIVAVTLGKGITLGKAKTIMCYIRNIQGEYQIESEKQKARKILETTGAGDAFAAGFLFGLLRDKQVKECGMIANVMAQFTIRKVGARKGLPTLNQLSQKYLQKTGHKL
jgi:ribokinase